MRFIIKSTFLLVLMLCPLVLAGQSLSELLDTARARNLELKALHQEYLAALERAPQVSQLPDPEVGVGAFLLPVETRLGAQNARLSVSQMFPWFGTQGARKDLAVAQARSLLEREASKMLDLGYEMKAAYFKLYEIQASREIIRKNIRILEALNEMALIKVESGKGSAADVLRVDLKIAELEQELRILDKQMEKPVADLNQILNRPLNTRIIVRDTFRMAVMPFDKDTLLSLVQANHPMLRMYALQQEAAREAIELNELEGKPSFGVGMDYIMVSPRSDFEPAANGRDILQLRARVQIPLWREKYNAREREENLKIEALENRKSNLETRFLTMVEKAFSDYETARLRQELYQEQISITKSAIRLLETEYSSTGKKFDELLQLEMELVVYDLKMLQAVVQGHIARAAVERYITY